MGKAREFFSEVIVDSHPLASYQQGDIPVRDRWILKDYLEYIHIKKGLLAPYNSEYPLVEARELLPSFEKNFAEYPELPGFSMVALNRTLSYQQEIFQFDLLHSFAEGKRRARANLDKILPHLDRDLRPDFRQRFAARDVTDLAYYEELLEFLLHMDRAQAIARDEEGDFRLLGIYASFPSDLDTELKNFGKNLGRFRKQDNEIYEQERDFVYQFFMELYGFPIASERRTSAALFARRLSRHKEQYLIKVLGSSDRTITSLCGYEQKKYPLVEKISLVSLPVSFVEANPYLKDQGFFVDPDQAVVILKVTYLQHKYNPLNVLEDRALSVLEQEIIHPYHGGRDAGVNILKDTKRFLKDLTDIVRGEYIGSISFKRQDLLTSTKTHEDRLKFLIAWLVKNQRRLATYSSESFEAAKKVLNSYLLNRDYKEAFAKHPELHREALRQMVLLNQSHQLQTLAKLNQKLADRRRLGPLPRISRALAFLEEKQDELPYFYPDMFDKFLNLWDQLMDYPYFRRLRSLPAPPALPYRRRAWQQMVLAQRLVNELKEQHREVQEEVKRGSPFPLLTPTFPPLPGKSQAAPEAPPGKNV
jgi:hypothetical protein